MVCPRALDLPTQTQLIDSLLGRVFCRPHTVLRTKQEAVQVSYVRDTWPKVAIKEIP